MDHVSVSAFSRDGTDCGPPFATRYQLTKKGVEPMTSAQPTMMVGLVLFIRGSYGNAGRHRAKTTKGVEYGYVDEGVSV